MSEQKKLYRSIDNRVLGGVCGGLGEYLNIDPVLIRIIFVLLTVNGFGIIAYFLMWLLIPEETTTLEGEDLIRSNLDEMTTRARSVLKSSNSELLIGGLLVGAGILFLARNFIPAIPQGVLLPAILIIIGAVLLIRR